MCILVTISMVGNVYASDQYTDTEKITIYQVSENKWIIQDNKENKFALKKELKSIDQLDYVYVTSEGEYFQKIDDKVLVPCDVITKSLNNFDDYKSIQKYQMPDEIMRDIASMADFAKRNNCADAKVSFVVSQNNIDEKTQNVKATGVKNTSKTKTTWDGKTFYNYEIVFTNMWTSWQTIAEKGSTTQSVLNSIKDLVMNVAGSVSSKIGIISSIFSSGKSCLQTWKDVTGKTPIYGNNSNKVMDDIKYKMTLKYTYYYDKMAKREMLGCSSQKAKINKVDTDTYLYSSSGGKRVEQTIQPKKVFRTPNYSNPEQKAYEHRNSPWTEKVTGKIKNKKIVFTYPSFSWPSDWPKN